MTMRVRTFQDLKPWCEDISRKYVILREMSFLVEIEFWRKPGG